MVLLKNLVLIGLAAAAAAKSAVLDLIPENFDQIVLKSNKPVLVEFFAPWCGHCKNLAPVYEELANLFEFASNKISIAKVDADAEKSLGKRFGIQGFPTLKWFDGKSDKPEDYTGGRDLESLTNFITEKTGIKPKKKGVISSAVDILTDESFREKIGGDQDVLVAFTAPWCGHCKNLAPIWETLAHDFESEPDVLIAKVDAEAENSKATAKNENVSGYPTIKFFPKGSKTGEVYSGGRTEKDFVDFINSNSGTHRTVGGGLDQVAGTIETLDKIVSRLAGSASISEVAEEVVKVAQGLKKSTQHNYAKYYVKVLDKLRKSDKYAAKELVRLEGLLKKGGLASAKMDEFTSKTNILRKFVEKAHHVDEL